MRLLILILLISCNPVKEIYVVEEELTVILVEDNIRDGYRVKVVYLEDSRGNVFYEFTTPSSELKKGDKIRRLR